MKWLKSILQRKNPKSMMIDEIILAEVNLVQAKLHLDSMQAECSKQEVNVKMYEDRIVRLNADLKTLMEASKENT